MGRFTPSSSPSSFPEAGNSMGAIDGRATYDKAVTVHSGQCSINGWINWTVAVRSPSAHR